MDGQMLAQTLIRSIARSFYPTDQILILEAIILHSAIRDEDLAFVLGSQKKHTRKLCSKLREDGLLNIEARSEQKPGHNKPTNRDYYYVNFHRAIDVIKFRLKKMAKEVEARFGGKEEEKKEYFCKRCKSEWTQMDVLDRLDPMTGEFECKRCGFAPLERNDESNGASQNGKLGRGSKGYEIQSRLNDQLGAFEELMRKIDEAKVPENTFEEALERAQPVERDPNLNPQSASEPYDPAKHGLRPGMKLPPATVHGMKTEAEKVQVTVTDDSNETRLAEEQAVRDKKAKDIAQNALPAWHLNSTVTGEKTALGEKEEALRREREANGVLPISNGGGHEEEKPEADGLEDDTQLNAYLAAVREEEEKRRRDEAAKAEAKKRKREEGSSSSGDEDEDDDEEEEDDEDDFEDVGLEESGEPPAKRVKVDSPIENGASSNVNGLAKGENQREKNEQESLAKKEQVQGHAHKTNGLQPPPNPSQPGSSAGNTEDDSDEDEDDFEDAM